MTWKRLANVTSQIVFDAEGNETEEEREKYLALENEKSDQPRGRSSHSLSAAKLSNGRELLVLFGGEDIPRHAFENCLWTFDLKDGNAGWKKLETSGEIPCERLGHVGVIVEDNFWVFGGRTNDKRDLNDLYSCNLLTGAWKQHQATGEVPKDRSYHAADAAGNSLFVWSGCTMIEDQFTRMNDLHRLDLQNLKWEKLQVNGEVPEARGGSNVAALNANHLIVFGGFAGRQLGDLITYDTASHSWNKIDVQSTENPEPRSVSCGVSLDGGRFFVFGGEKEASATGHEGAGMYFNDAFVLDVANKQWKKVQAGGEDPTARGWFSAASLGNDVYLFGGYDGVGRINDLFQITV